MGEPAFKSIAHCKRMVTAIRIMLHHAITHQWAVPCAWGSAEGYHCGRGKQRITARLTSCLHSFPL